MGQVCAFLVALICRLKNLLLAQNSRLSLLFRISLRENVECKISDLTLIDERFPLDGLKRTGKPTDENKDDGDSEVEDDDDDEDSQEKA